MNLREIFDKHKTDKGTKHHYDKVYETLFSEKRNEEINFLEVGIFKGASTAAFHEYFPNGNIYGIDIFVREEADNIEILNEERVHYLKADSMSPQVTSLLSDEFDIQYDYILDDGAHYPQANLLTFRHLSPLLKSGGLYIIEDVWPLELMNETERKHNWIKKYPNLYNDIENSKFLNELANSGMSISRFDLRKESGQPDSYVIVLEKE